MSQNKTVSPYKTAMDEGNAYWMARLADVAYTRQAADDPAPDESAIFAELRSEDRRFEKVTGYSKKSSQAMLVEHADYLCMAFRGTDQAADWMDNLDMNFVDTPFGRFHEGFWRATDDLWARLYGDYESAYARARRPLFFCGHSLGGAMATVAAARFAHNDWAFSGCYTFGQPRAADRATAARMNASCGARFFRFQNRNDIVTRIPPRAAGYSHVGAYAYIDGDDCIADDIGFWHRFLNFCVVGAVDIARDKKLSLIGDHEMSRYLAAITKWHWKK